MGWTLVTGGAQRLGAEICRTLAKQGYDVVIHYNHSHREAIHLVKECRKLGVKAECLQGDFSERSSTEHFVQGYLKQFPDTVNLINNVGNYIMKSGLNTDLSEWYDLIQTNLNAPYELIRGLIPSIKKNRGSILNLGVAGMEGLRADVHATVYTLTKTALWMLTRSLAKELAPDLVRVNMVSPGYLEISVDLPKDLSTIPMKRTGTTQEVAKVIVELLGPNSTYITGQNIEVAGGIGL
jgi:NAD(P)-dependent dehydrogenase (short-subunit alcohol dehydrogenase family)